MPKAISRQPLFRYPPISFTTHIAHYSQCPLHTYRSLIPQCPLRHMPLAAPLPSTVHAARCTLPSTAHTARCPPALYGTYCSLISVTCPSCTWRIQRTGYTGVYSLCQAYIGSLHRFAPSFVDLTAFPNQMLMYGKETDYYRIPPHSLSHKINFYLLTFG